jgi:hypothetical protein
MGSYCDFAIGNAIHGPYHDLEYGFPVDDECRLFERLLLEINQAGLSWELMLKKREGFRQPTPDSMSTGWRHSARPIERGCWPMRKSSATG